MTHYRSVIDLRAIALMSTYCFYNLTRKMQKVEADASLQRLQDQRQQVPKSLSFFHPMNPEQSLRWSLLSGETGN